MRAMDKNHSFLDAVPMSKIVNRVLGYSIRTVEAWELIDIDFARALLSQIFQGWSVLRAVQKNTPKI